MSSVVQIKKRRSFSAIPDDILQDKRMRCETRLVLGWLIGRPDGWEVRVNNVQYTLGLSRDRWRKARKEMQQFGYLLQIRKQQPDGTYKWLHIVSDTPMDTKETIVAKSNDGEADEGKPNDITTETNQNKLNTPLNPPVAITQACYEEARQNFQGYDIHVLEATWKEWLSGKKEEPKYPDRAFLAWARTYTQNHPLPYGGKF